MRVPGTSRIPNLMIMWLGAALGTPIMLLNWIAPVVATVWLLLIHEGTIVLAGYLSFAISALLFSLIVKRLPTIRSPIGKNVTLAYVVYLAFNFFVFILVVAYSAAAFDVAEHKSLPSLPMALWAYSTAGAPWMVIVSRTHHSDPLSIIWPSVASYGNLALMLAMLTGASTTMQGFILAMGCLTGFYQGWLVGTHRISMLERSSNGPS